MTEDAVPDASAPQPRLPRPVSPQARVPEPSPPQSHAPDASPPDLTYLQSLLVDYEQGREEERSFYILQGTVLTLCLTALTALGALANEVAKGTKIAAPVLAAAPLPVIAILAFLQAAGTMAVIRSFYLRALEREIREKLSVDNDLARYRGLRPLSYIELLNTYNSLSPRGSRISSFQKVMAVIIFAILCLVFGGLTIFLGLKVTLPWQLAMLLIYGVGASAILTETIKSNLQGRVTFKRYVRATGSRLGKSLNPVRKGRRDQKIGDLAVYLIIPRPDDLAKAIYVVLGAFLAWVTVASAGLHTRAGLFEMLMFFVGFELLVYQSRYQWNDIRGVYEDRKAPLAKARRRLPGDDVRASIRYSLIVMLVRVYLVLWIVSLKWDTDDSRFSFSDGILLASIPAVYLIAACYEWARGRTRASERCGPGNFVAVLLLVSLGYPLRFGLGWAAVGGPLLNVNFVLAVAAFAGLGLGVVTLTWVLEAASYIRSTSAELQGSRGTASAAARSADRRYIAKEAIRRKAHLLKLLKVSGARVDVEPADFHEKVCGSQLKFLQEVRWSVLAPWRIGAVIWVTGISIAGGSLVGLPVLAPWQWGLIAAAALLLPLHNVGGTMPFLISGAVLTTGFAAAVATHWRQVGEAELLPYQLSALLVISIIQPACYLFFYASSYQDTRDGAYRLMKGTGKCAVKVGRWFIGAPSPRPRANRN